MGTNPNGNKARKTLSDLFVDELADMYDAEKHIVKALPKLAKGAVSPELKKALFGHLKETEGHVTKLEEVFAAFDRKPKGKKCEAIAGLLKEGEEILEEFKDSPAGDAAIISAGQKVEHYEIASYGCLHEWAGILGNEVAAGLLEEILEEEMAADEKLTEIAQTSVNEKARSDSDDEDEDEDEDDDEEEELKQASIPRRTASRAQGATVSAKR